MNRAFDLFGNTYRAKCPSAVEHRVKDRDMLMTFYDFPTEYWVHLRTTNPTERTFATVRLQYDKTRNTALAPRA